MPIRFRCAYCNQLMGIARRKAGTVVRCPTCAGQVIVPSPAGKADLPSDEPRPGAAGLFEAADLEKELFDSPEVRAGPVGTSAAGRSPGPVALGPNSPQNYDVVPLNAPAGAPAVGEFLDTEAGIFLTRGKMIVIGAIVVVLLGLAFWLGTLVGSS